MRFGHVNALRQAKALGDQLVVDVCSSHEIAIHKRDEPYVLINKFLTTLIETYHVDIVVNGDDPSCTEGKKEPLILQSITSPVGFPTFGAVN